MRANHIGRREIDQIPVVDARRVVHIQTKDRVTFGQRSALVCVAEKDDGEETRLVPVVVEQQLDLVERQATQLARKSSDVGHADSKKPVAFAILAGTRFEESL